MKRGHAVPPVPAEIAELERRLMAALKPFAGRRMTDASVQEIAKICQEVERQWRAERVAEGNYESRGGAYLGAVEDDPDVPNTRWMFYH